MERAVKFLIYSLSVSVLALSFSIEKSKTMEIVLGITISIGFVFSYFAIQKLCSGKNKKQNSNHNEEL